MYSGHIQFVNTFSHFVLCPFLSEMVSGDECAHTLSV